MPRRIAAIVLPQLLCELALQLAIAPVTSRYPFGVVLVTHADDVQCITDQSRLHAVDERARKLGLAAGMTVAQARAYVAAVSVHAVHDIQLEQALARVAEVALAFGPTVSIVMPDTVLVDLTGAAHLAGGEQAVASELAARVEQLDHYVRVVIADGPYLAAAIARHGLERVVVVPAGQASRWMHGLPIVALPIEAETASWLVRVGVMTVGDLTQLPRAQVASRLGDAAPQIMALLSGFDPSPLHPYEPPQQVCEQAQWEQGLERQEALVFVLHRLASRVGARLEGRGEATVELELTSEATILTLTEVPRES